MTKTKFETPDFRLPTNRDILEKIKFMTGDFEDTKSKACALACLHSVWRHRKCAGDVEFTDFYLQQCATVKATPELAVFVLDHFMEEDLVEHNGKIIWPYLNGVAQ